MKLTAICDVFRLREAFTISRGSRTEQAVVTVTLTDGAFRVGANAPPMPGTLRASRA